MGRVYLGLTDEEAPGPIPDVPDPTPQEVAFLLDTANTALQTALTTADVTGAYAGLRPLIDAGEGRTSDLSRDHAVLENDSGMFSIVGGKLTEYRLMAQDVLDRAIAARGLSAGSCRTRNLPLVGANHVGSEHFSESYRPHWWPLRCRSRCHDLGPMRPAGRTGGRGYRRHPC